MQGSRGGNPGGQMGHTGHPNRGGMNQLRDRNNHLNRDQALQYWNTMRDAIQMIYAHQSSQLSYEELYRTAYQMVLHKHGEMLYDNVKKTTAEML